LLVAVEQLGRRAASSAKVKVIISTSGEGSPWVVRGSNMLFGIIRVTDWLDTLLMEGSSKRKWTSNVKMGLQMKGFILQNELQS